MARLLTQSRPIVLVVDDDEGVRDALTIDLQGDFDVVAVPDGPSALALLRRQAVDLVLLDLILPDIGGLEVLPAIKAIDPGLPVIVVSGIKQTATVVNGMRLGADNYLTKPWQELELLGAVRAALGQRPGGGRGVLLVGDDFESLAPLQVALAGDVPVQAMTVAVALLGGEPGPAVMIVDGDSESTRTGAALPALRDRYPRCLMLVVTADPAAPRRALGGAAEVVAKPYRLDDLLRRAGCSKRLGHHAARAADYIGRHYRAPLALRDVAGFVGLSTDRLAHLFRDEVGMPMKEYALRLRVAVGCRLLGESDRKIEDIAQWLGFQHASHFSRVFVAVAGVRPGVYRRRAQHEP